MYVQYKDAAGNISATYSDSTNIDTGAASITLAAGAAYYTIDRTPAITLTASANADEYRLCSAADCSVEVRSWTNYTATPTAYTFPADGASKLWVQYRDSSDVVIGGIIESNTVNIDTIDPTNASTLSWSRVPTLSRLQSQLIGLRVDLRRSITRTKCLQ